MSSISKIQVDNNEKYLISSLMTEKTSPFYVTNTVGRVSSGVKINEGDSVEELFKLALTLPDHPTVKLEFANIKDNTIDLINSSVNYVVLKISISNTTDVIQSVVIKNNDTVISASSSSGINLYTDEACTTKATSLTNDTYYYKINNIIPPEMNIEIQVRTKFVTESVKQTINITYPIFFGVVLNNLRSDIKVSYYCYSNGSSIIYLKDTTLTEGIDYYLSTNLIIFTIGGQIKKSKVSNKYYTVQDTEQYRFSSNNKLAKTIIINEKQNNVDPEAARTVTESDLNNCMVSNVKSLPYTSEAISFTRQCPFFAYPARFGELKTISMDCDAIYLYDKISFNIIYNSSSKTYSIAKQTSGMTTGTPYNCYVKHDYFTADKPVKFIFT